jgi:hypothetical protein
MINIVTVGKDTAVKKRIADEVEKAARLFISAGVEKAEQACNQKRLSLLDSMRQLDPDKFLLDRGLPDVKVRQAIIELEPPFQLTQPATIKIDLTYDYYDPNRDTAMVAVPSESTVYVFANAIDPATLRDLHGGMPVRDIAFHEMLHLCKEAQHDGVIRYNWAGVEAIKELLGL